MKEYRVEVSIDVDANSPREAAEAAEKLLMQPTSRWVCDVYDGEGKIRVDLEDEEDKGEQVYD